MEDIKPTGVNYITDRRTSSYTYLPWRIRVQTGRSKEGGVVRGRRCEPKRQKEKGDLPRLRREPKVTVPNDVTALICWRLAVERVFNQSV